MTSFTWFPTSRSACRRLPRPTSNAAAARATPWNAAGGSGASTREMHRLGADLVHGPDFAVPYIPRRPSVLTLHDLSPWMDRALAPRRQTRAPPHAGAARSGGRHHDHDARERRAQAGHRVFPPGSRPRGGRSRSARAVAPAGRGIRRRRTRPISSSWEPWSRARTCWRWWKRGARCGAITPSTWCWPDARRADAPAIAEEPGLRLHRAKFPTRNCPSCIPARWPWSVLSL